MSYPRVRRLRRIARTIPPRRLSVLILAAAAILSCWTVYLALTVPASEHRSHWVALDTLEVIVLLATARALRYGRRWRVAAAASCAVPLLWYDVGIDITSSHHSGVELAVASAMAVLVELPMSAAMLALALRFALHPRLSTLRTDTTLPPPGTRHS